MSPHPPNSLPLLFSYSHSPNSLHFSLPARSSQLPDPFFSLSLSVNFLPFPSLDILLLPVLSLSLHAPQLASQLVTHYLPSTHLPISPLYIISLLFPYMPSFQLPALLILYFSHSHNFRPPPSPYKPSS